MAASRDQQIKLSSPISKLSTEVLQNVFYHFETADSKVMFDCLTVNKAFFAAMSGPALLADVNVQSISRIPQLVSYLGRNPRHAAHIRCLQFNLKPFRTQEADSNCYGLSQVGRLLELTTRIRQLYDTPVYLPDKATVISAIHKLKYLTTFSSKIYTSAHSGPPTLSHFSLQEIHTICQNNDNVCQLFFDRYQIVLSPE